MEDNKIDVNVTMTEFDEYRQLNNEMGELMRNINNEYFQSHERLKINMDPDELEAFSTKMEQMHDLYNSICDKLIEMKMFKIENAGLTYYIRCTPDEYG